MKSGGAILLPIVCLGFTLTTHAGSTNTIGLILNTTNASPGYTLFSSLRYTNTYLINNEGELLHLWRAQYVPGNTHYLLDNGNLVRTADPGPLSTIAAGGDAEDHGFNADMGIEYDRYYATVAVNETEFKGTVFVAATMEWSHGLYRNGGPVSTITHNVLRRLGR